MVYSRDLAWEINTWAPLGVQREKGFPEPGRGLLEAKAERPAGVEQEAGSNREAGATGGFCPGPSGTGRAAWALPPRGS